MNKVLLEKREGYAIVTLNRPEAMNALSSALREDFVAVFAECCADEDIRVIVLTGNGRAFSAGMDLKELASAEVSPDQSMDNAMARAMEGFDGPIIGAINGHAVTGGFEMALACDVLIAGESARFADTHARVGLLPGWGLSQKLPRLIGLSRAKEISFTGAPVFARQAYEWGLVNHVVPDEQLLEKACDMAAAMCDCVPDVLRRYKRLIEDGYNMPYAEALAWEEKLSIESAAGVPAGTIAERRAGVMARGRSERDE